MKKLILIGVFAGLAWFGYTRVQADAQQAATASPSAQPIQAAPGAVSPAFKCDGRTKCAQMTSCAEATFFVQHCPNTTMDGDGDGEPCEQQWCSAES